jgi:hypothetical protein
VKKENKKEVQEVRSSLKISRSDRSTHIVALAQSKNSNDDKTISIDCEKGECVTHKVVYDITKDKIHLNCIDYFDLGIIGCSYAIRDKENYPIHIPLPETILKKYIDSRRLEEFNEWVLKHSSDTVEISYLQILHSY